MKDPRISFGTTTYSFNDDYYSGRYSLDDCLRKIGGLGGQQGFELAGA